MDNKFGIYFLTSFLAVLYCIPLSSGSVTIDVGLLKYKHLATQRCDNVMLFRRCDPFFRVCFEMPPDNRCDWIETSSVDEKDELTDILHNHRIQPNPISRTSETWPGNVNVRIQIWDANLFSADKIIDEANWTYNGTANVSLTEVSLVGNRQKASVTVSINIVCDENYHGPSCTTYCQKTAYRLCSENGTVTCVPGFSGFNCSTPADTNGSTIATTNRRTVTPDPWMTYSEIQMKTVETIENLTNSTTMTFQNHSTTNVASGTTLISSSYGTLDHTPSPVKNVSLMSADSTDYNTSTTSPSPDISRTLLYPITQHTIREPTMITRESPTSTSNTSASSFSAPKHFTDHSSRTMSSKKISKKPYPVETSTPFLFSPVIAKILRMSKSLSLKQTTINLSTHTMLFNSSTSTTAVNTKKDAVSDNTAYEYSTLSFLNNSVRSYNTTSLTSLLTSKLSRNRTIPTSPSDSRTARPLATEIHSPNVSFDFDTTILHNTTNRTNLTAITNTSVDIKLSETHEASLLYSSIDTQSTLQPSRPAYETTKRSVFKTWHFTQSALSRSKQADNIQPSTNSPTSNYSSRPLSTHITEPGSTNHSSNRITYSTTKSFPSLLTHGTRDYTQSAKADISVARTSLTMSRRKFEYPTATTYASVPNKKLNTPTNLSGAKPSSETGKGGNLGVSSSSSEKNVKQTRSFLWGIGVSIFILFVVCIGSLVLWKLKRRQRQKPPAIELIHEIKIDDTPDYKEGHLHLHLNKLEVIPECVDNPALDTNETDT